MSNRYDGNDFFFYKFTEMQSSLGVGRKSLRELDSDRGAETYDFSLAAEVKAKEEAAALEGQKKDLDQDLDQYFTSKGSQETTPTEMENAGLPERSVTLLKILYNAFIP